MNILIDIIGWIGSGLLILAYQLVSNKTIQPESLKYHFLNISGSILLIVNSGYYGAFPSAAVNIIFVMIGLFYVSKLFNHAK